MLEMSARAFIISAEFVRVGVPSPPTPPQLVSSAISVLSSFKWKEHHSVGIVLIDMTGGLFTCFPRAFSTPQFISNLAAIYCKALDYDTYGGLIQPVLAAGETFPVAFSAAVLRDLDAKGVHKMLRTTLFHFEKMEEKMITNVLVSLLQFLRASPTTAQKYVAENLHITLLFAAQKYHSSVVFQDYVWQMESYLCKGCPQYFDDLQPCALVDSIATVLQEQDHSMLLIGPINRFLGLCICTGSFGLTVIPACLDKQVVIVNILSMLDPSREVRSEEDMEELVLVSRLMLLMSTQVLQPTVESLVRYRVTNHLKNSALKWPKQLTTIVCKALETMLSHFPPDPTLLSSSEAQPTSENMLQTQEKFFSDDYLQFIQTLLGDSSLSGGDRASIYTALRKLLIFCTADFAKKFIKREFLEVFVAATRKDVVERSNTIHLIFGAAHIIVARINQFGCEEDCKILTELGFIDVLTLTLRLSNYYSAHMSTFDTLYSLLSCYRDLVNDTSVVAKSDIPVLIVDMAINHGKKAKNSRLQGQLQEVKDIQDILHKILLDMTSHKSACEVLASQKFIRKLYLLATDEYEMPIVYAALHSVGNIAIHGNEVQLIVIADQFHLKLLHNVNHPQSVHDQVLKATFRVLSILSNSNQAKIAIISCGIMDSIFCLLDRYTKNSDMCWRILGLLMSVGIISVCNLEVFFTEKVLRRMHKIFKSSDDTKIISYIVLIFLITTDLDKHAILLCSLGTTDALQKMSKELVESDSDLKRWHRSVLEKCNLFTIMVSCTLMESDVNRMVVENLSGSVTWPLHSISNSSNLTHALLNIDKQYLSHQCPVAPLLLAEDKLRLSQLGLSPDKPLFRVGRLFGNNFKSCSNCESKDRGEELVFRPESMTPHQYQVLIDNGWYRRGGVDMFRFRYVHSLECSDWETRVILSEFNHRSHKSYRKVLRKVPDSMTIETIPTQFLKESFDLYNVYNIKKHDKTDTSSYSYQEHAVNSPVGNETIDGIEYGTFHQLYRLNGKLVAVGLIDVVPNGVVSLYMWYDMSKEMQKLSLGVYSALKEIEFAQKLSERNPAIKYYYMQGWNGKNHKLSYKANYTPEEFYSPCTVTGWVRGLDAVKQAQEEVREKWRLAQQATSVTEETDTGKMESPVGAQNSDSTKKKASKDKTEVVPGDAISMDRVRYQCITGSTSVDVGSVVICLNHKQYLPFRELIQGHQVEDEQRQLLETRLEELVLAVGPELSSNMVVDMKACPAFLSST